MTNTPAPVVPGEINKIKMLGCMYLRVGGHHWVGIGGKFPTHGYRNIPHDDSYCDHCGITGTQFQQQRFRRWL